MAKKESQDGKSKKGLPRLMELAMTQKAPMVGGMLLSAMATIASFLPYLAIYFIIQEIVGAYPDFSTLDVPKVLGYGGLALGGVLLNVLLYTASVALSHIAAYGTLYQCKINYISHITKLPLGYHLKMGSGKLRKVMDDNIESLEGFIAHDLPNMISAFVAPVVMLVLVFAVDWRFGLATFVGIIVSFLVYGATSGGNKTKKLMEDYQTSLEDMSNASVEYIPSLSMPSGKITAIIGTNGAGKSTFVSYMCGLMKKNKGTFLLDGKKQTAKERVQKSYLVMQEVNHQLFSDSVREEIVLGNRDSSENSLQKIMETLDISVLTERHPMTLSGGQKQRVIIASAMFCGKKILYFDEPTSGLDFSHMMQTCQLLNQLHGEDVFVFIITHDYELIASVCDSVIHIEHGKLFEQYDLDANGIQKLKSFFTQCARNTI